MSDCRERIERLLRREPVALPAGCSEDAITQWFAFRDGWGLVHRGSKQVEYTFRVLSSGEFTFHFADGVLAFIETEHNPFPLEQLGEPEALLELAFDVSLIPDAMRVYASRGIAAGVIPETGAIVSVTAFPPCTVEEYRERYYAAQPVREFEF